MAIANFPPELVDIFAPNCSKTDLSNLGKTCRALNSRVAYSLYAMHRADAAQWAATACFAADQTTKRAALTVLRRCDFKRATQEDYEYFVLSALAIHFAELPTDSNMPEATLALMSGVCHDSYLEFPGPNYVVPISLVARFNAIELLRSILARGKAAGDTLNWALQAACAFSKADAVRVLLDAGADPNTTTSGGSRRTEGSEIIDTDLHSFRPIENAAMGDSTGKVAEKDKIIRLLLDNGAQPTPQSLILSATLQSSIDIAKALVHRGCGLNSQTATNRTPLMAAVSAGNTNLVRHLLSVDHVDTSIARHDGWTPLIMATYIGRKDIFSDVVKRSRQLVNVADENGRTPVMYAALLGHTDIVIDLVDNYAADLKPKDQWGNTALLFAVRSCNGDIVQALADKLRFDFSQFVSDQTVDTIDIYDHQCQVCEKTFVCQQSECQELDTHCRENTNHVWKPSICQIEGSGKRMNRALCNYNKSDRLEPQQLSVLGNST